MRFFLFRFLAFPLVLAVLMLLFREVSRIPQLSDAIVFVAFLASVGLAFAYLFYYLAEEALQSHKVLQKTKRNINLSILGFYSLFFAFIFWVFFSDEYMYSEMSPDGNYELEVYTERQYFAMPGGGGLYSRPTKIVLKNKWGWTIGESTDDCGAFYGDIEIAWDMEHQEVSFAKAASIDLNTGKCSH